MFRGMHYNAGGRVVRGGGCGGRDGGELRGEGGMEGCGVEGGQVVCSQDVHRYALQYGSWGGRGGGVVGGLSLFLFFGGHGRVQGGRGAGGLFTRCSEVCITMLEVGWEGWGCGGGVEFVFVFWGAWKGAGWEGGRGPVHKMFRGMHYNAGGGVGGAGGVVGGGSMEGCRVGGGLFTRCSEVLITILEVGWWEWRWGGLGGGGLAQSVV